VGGTHWLGCRSLHRGSDCRIFRVNIALRNRNVTAAGEICQRERVHLRRPSRQASVAPTVKLERSDPCHTEDSQLLFLDAGAFHMSASRRRWKQPPATFQFLLTMDLTEICRLLDSSNLLLFRVHPILNNGTDSRSHWNPSPRGSCLPMC